MYSSLRSASWWVQVATSACAKFTGISPFFQFLFLRLHTFLPSSLMDIILLSLLCNDEFSAMYFALPARTKRLSFCGGRFSARRFCRQMSFYGDRIFHSCQGEIRYRKSFSLAVHLSLVLECAPASGRLPPHPRLLGPAVPRSAFRFTVTGSAASTGNLRAYATVKRTGS